MSTPKKPPLPPPTPPKPPAHKPPPPPPLEQGTVGITGRRPPTGGATPPALPDEVRRRPPPRPGPGAGRDKQLEDALKLAFGHGGAGEDTDPGVATEPGAANAPWADQVKALEARLGSELAATPEEHNRLRAILLHELGQLAELNQEDQALARERYTEAMAWDGTFLPAIRSLARHREEEGSWSELVILLAAETELCPDGRTRAALMTRAGVVLAFHLSDMEGAVERLRGALALEPRAGNAALVLRYLFASQERWEDLLELLRGLAGVSHSEAERAWLLQEMAELCEVQLNRPEEALELYARAHALSPGRLNARVALLRLRQRLHRWQELADLLEKEAMEEGEAAPRFAHLYRAARLAELYLQDDGHAAELLERARELRPVDPLPLEELAVIYQRLGQPAEQVKVLTRGLELAHRPVDRAALSHRIGAILEHQLARPEEAMDAYRQALEDQPGHEATLRALAALYEGSGQWRPLIELELLRAERQKDAGRRSLGYVRAARLCEERLKDRRQAQDLMERAWRLDAPPTAFLTLERLYRLAGRWDALVELYLDQARKTTDQALALNLRRGAALICEEMLEDRGRAVLLLEEVHARSAASGDQAQQRLERLTLLDLIRLHEEGGDRPERLLELLGMWAEQTPDTRLQVALRRRQAELLEGPLDQPERALARYTRLARQEPADRHSLERLKAMETRAGRWNALLALLRQELELERDAAPAERAQLLLQVGMLYLYRLGEADRARQVWDEALALDPDCTPARAALEELLREQGRWDQLVDLLQGEVAGNLGAARLCAAAEICNERFGDQARARGLYEQALALDAGCVPAAAGLERVCQAELDLDGLARLHEAAALDRADLPAKVRALLRLAHLRALPGGDLDAGVEALERALVLLPDQPDVLMSLGRLHRRAGRPGPLDQILARIVDSEAGEDPAVQLAALRERALILAMGSSSAGEESAEVQRRILLARPHDPLAMTELERSSFARGDKPALIALSRRALEAGGDELWIVSVCLRGALLLCEMRSWDQAAEVLREGLSSSPGYLPAVLLLRMVARRQGWIEEEIELLQREGELANERPAAHASLLRAGDLLLQHFEDLARARAAYEQVFDEDPASDGAFRRLERMLRDSGEWRPMAALLKRRLLVMEPGQRAPILLALCAVQRDHLLDPVAAADSLEQLLAQEPEHLEALSTAADLARALHRWSDAESYLANLADGSRGDPEARRRAMLDRAKLLDERLQQVDLSLEVLQELLSERPGDREALSACAAIFQRRRQWERLVEVLEELARSARGAEKVGHLVALADVHIGSREDKDEAAAAMGRAAATCLESGEGVGALAKHFQRRGDHQGLADLLGATLEGVVGETDGSRAMRVCLARTLADELEQVDLAELELTRAVQAAPADLALRLELAGLLTRAGKPGDATTHYMTVLEQDAFAVEAHRGLAALWSSRGDMARAAGAAQVVCALTGGEQDERRASLAATAELDQRFNNATATHTSEDPGDLLHLLAHPDEPDLLRELMRVLGDAIPAIYPAQVEAAEPGAAQKVPVKRLGRTDPMARQCQALADLIGVECREVLMAPLPGEQLAVALPGASRLCLDPVRCTDLPAARVRFALGRALTRMHTRSLYLDLLTVREVDLLLAAVAENFQRGYAGNRPDGAAVVELARAVGRALPRKIRKALEGPARALAASPDPNPAAWAVGARFTADRVGLVLGGDTVEAHATLAEERRGRDAMAHLLRFAVSPHLIEARRRLGIG